MTGETVTDAAGERLGPWVVEQELGVGAQARVYRCRHARLGHAMALKVVRLGDAQGDRGARRLERECQALSRLEHEAILRVEDVAGDAKRRWMPMELCAGSLADLLRSGRRPDADEACRWIQRLAEGLGHAHGRGIVHRDIKPENMLFRATGEVVLADFGVAAAAGESSSEAAGSLAYMAPEQLDSRRRPVDGRADIHALGAVLFELIAGHPPYAADSPEALARRVLTAPVPSLPAEAGSDSALDTILQRCLAKDPDDRYPDAGALAEDLRRRAAGEPILARPVGPLEHLRLWSRRSPRLAAALALAGLLLPLIGGVALALAARARSRGLRRASEARRQAEAATDEARAAARDARREEEASARARDQALQALAEADAAAAAAEQALDELEQARREAAEQEARSSRRFGELRDLARFVLYEFHDRVAQRPGSMAIRRKLAERARRYLEVLADGASPPPRLALELADSWLRIAAVSAGRRSPNVGDLEGAIEAVRRALALLDREIEDPRLRRAFALRRVRCRRVEAEVQLERMKSDRVAQLVKDARAELKTLGPVDGDFELLLEDVALELCTLRVSMLQSSPQKTTDRLLALHERLAELRRSRREYATSAGFLKLAAEVASLISIVGFHSLKLKRLAELNEAALTDLDRILAQRENDFDSLMLKAELLNNIGTARFQKGQHRKALGPFDEAVEILERLEAAEEGNTRVAMMLATARSNRGAVLIKLKRPKRALQDLRKSTQVYRRLVKAHPTNSGWQMMRFFAENNLGSALHNLGKQPEALAAYDRAEQIARTLAEASGGPNALLYENLALVGLNRAYCLKSIKGRRRDALASARASRKNYDRCLREGRGSPEIKARRAQIRKLELRLQKQLESGDKTPPGSK